MKIWIASVAAVAAQPLVLAARITPDLHVSSGPVFGLGFFLLAVITVAAAATLLIGIPVFMALRKFQRDSWASLGIVGFMIGAVPVAFSWPSPMEGYSSGQSWHGTYVHLYVNGMPTKYAWLTYAENIAFFGIHGLVGALVFYAVWRRLGRTQHVVTAGEA